MNTDFNYIKEDSFEKRSHLLEQFADNGLEKAITEKEFTAKYGVGHQVFTMDGINKFVQNTTKEEASEEVIKGIEDELKTLTKVVVKTNDGYESRYVREMGPTDISKSEEQEDESEESEESEGSEEDEEDDDEEDDESKNLIKADLWNILEKGKSVPVGTVSNGRKKIAEGKWRPVGKGGNSTKSAESGIGVSDKDKETVGKIQDMMSKERMKSVVDHLIAMGISKETAEETAKEHKDTLQEKGRSGITGGMIDKAKKIDQVKGDEKS